MDDIADDILGAAMRCERAAALFDDEQLKSACDALHEAADSLDLAASGSWIGHYSTIYVNGLRPKRPGEVFDTEWGNMQSPANRTVGDWAYYEYNDVKQEILARAKVSDLSGITSASKDCREAFERSKSELLATCEALLSLQEDAALRARYDELKKLSSHITANAFMALYAPKGSSIVRDAIAANAGLQVPHHRRFDLWLMEKQSYGSRASELASMARAMLLYMRQKYKLKGKTMAKTDGSIFIGHGRSQDWRELQEFIEKRIGRPVVEFNSEPTPGLSTKERLQRMLDEACFALIVMTAEDDAGEGHKRARENVVHECGLFQGRLGFERAIVLLENGCSEFSNIAGLGQIRFDKGKLRAVFEDVRAVLEREEIRTW